MATYPTFEERQILTAAQLNQIVTSVQSDIAGLSSLDVTWPLVAQGELDMNGFAISNVQKFFNVYDVSSFDSLGDAITQIESDGGGILLIPAETTIVADGVTFDVSNITIIGAGKSSVLQITSSATSGYLLRSSTSGLSGVEFHNFKIDGNAGTGTSQDGIQLRNCSKVVVDNLWFNDFSGNALELTNSGVAGNGCNDVRVSTCRFSSGDAAHIRADDLTDAVFDRILSENGGSDGLDFTATSGGNMSYVYFSDVQLDTYTGTGLTVLGSGGTASDAFSEIYLTRVTARGGLGTGEGIVLGSAANTLRNVFLSGCAVYDSTRDGIRVDSDGGEANGCTVDGATAIGLDLLGSIDFDVQGGRYVNNGTYGVDGGDVTDCRVVGADLRGNTTAGILRGGTNLYVSGCEGVVNLPRGGHFEYVNATTSGTGADQELFSYTVPAGVLADPGSVMRWRVYGSTAGANAARSVDVDFGSTEVGGVTPDSAAMNFVIEGAIVSETANSQRTFHYALASGTISSGAGPSGTNPTEDATSSITFTVDATINNAGDTVTVTLVEIWFEGGDS